MTRPVVLCDCDGVLVDLLPEWLDAYADAGGEQLQPADITEYGWENFVKDRELFLRILKSAGIFASARPMLYALPGLAQLRMFADVTLVTKVSGSRAMDNRIGWLFRHVRPVITTPEVIFTGRKELVWGNWLIEDAPENLDRWLKAWPHGRGVIINQPYNQKYAHKRVKRVANLLEAARYIKGQHT